MSSKIQTDISLPCPAEKLLVHRAPMLLIKELTVRENQRAEALASISDAGICTTSDQGLLPEYFIEIMAQTVAAAFGYDALIKNESPTEGYIVGIDKYSLINLPAKRSELGSELRVHVQLEHDLGTVKVITGEVFSNTEKLVTAELKLWKQES